MVDDDRWHAFSMSGVAACYGMEMTGGSFSASAFFYLAARGDHTPFHRFSTLQTTDLFAASTFYLADDGQKVFFSDILLKPDMVIPMFDHPDAGDVWAGAELPRSLPAIVRMSAGEPTWAL
ncbi:MAG: hypothetical protein ACK5PS_03995 [Desulfopila sp.]